MTNTVIKKEFSLLQQLLFIIYKNSSQKERKEFDRYDTIEFVDVNKEIEAKEKK